MPIERFNHLAEAQYALAAKMAEYLFARLEHQPVCRIALSGGKTPQGLFELLATRDWVGRIPWAKMHLYWVDERCVPQDDPASNFGAFIRIARGRVPLEPALLHPMYEPGVDVETAARAYERAICAGVPAVSPDGLPAFDLLLLGLGADGHTASLFPGDAAVAERERLVYPVTQPRGNPPAPRLTMTLPLINAARWAVFLVSGPDKKKTVADLLSSSPAASTYPASLVKPAGLLSWYVDSSTV